MNILELKRKLLPMSGPQSGGGSGGGGGSGSGTQTQISELPEWARGYAKDTLEKGAALTEKPYQSYGQDRIAGFSPMQQQSQEGAANMQTNAGTGAGMGIAGAAAMQGLNQNYDGMQMRSQNFGNRAAQQYMSPYAMSAMQPELQEQARQSAMLGQQNAAKAVGQGAFGGSRSGLVEAERQRNLGIQQGNTIQTGMNTAYNNAMNQFNADQQRNMQAQQANIGQQQFGANLGLQGLQTALQGAGQLGQLGQQQFQQGMDINKLQNAYGGQQQALQQQGLTQAYEDFQNQQNYPYKQLGFMSDLIRGLPLGQQTATQMYTPNPSAAQNVAALGAGAYGLSKFMAEGGMAYADGGSVDSPDNVAAIVHTLSDADLQKAAQAAQARGDADQLEAIQNEMGMRASLKRGIAGGVTDSMVQKMAGGGGVLAFAKRGEVNSSSTDDDSDELRQRYIESAGDKNVYGAFGKYGMKSLDKLDQMKAYESLTPEQRDALDKANYARINKFGGEDPYAPMAEKIKGLEEAATKNYERAQGASILAALPKILEGGNAARGIAGGLGAYGTQIEQADRAHAAEKRGLAGINFNLSDAQRKERMAAGREAIGATKDIEANRLAAHTAERADIMAGITGAGKFAQAFRPVGGAGGAGGKAPKLNERLYDDNVANLLLTQKPKEGESTDQFNARIRAQAGELTAKQVKDMGAERSAAAAATLTAAQNRALSKHMSDFEESTAYKKAVKAGNAEEVYNTEAARKQQELMGGITKLARGGNIEPIKLD